MTPKDASALERESDQLVYKSQRDSFGTVWIDGGGDKNRG